MKTVNETAKIFGVKPLTVRRWIKSGKLKSFKIVLKLSKTKTAIEEEFYL